MATPFVISRAAPLRLVVSYKDFRTDCQGDDPKQIAMALTNLGLNAKDAKLQAALKAAMASFFALERRAEETFGKDKTFRIWRVDAKTLQVDFKGGHAELKDSANGDAALKKCLTELWANHFLLPDLKRELAAFRKDERPEPMEDVLFFRDDGSLKVVAGDRVHEVARDGDEAVLKLAKTLKMIEPQRFLATYHTFQSVENRIRKALGRSPK